MGSFERNFDNTLEFFADFNMWRTFWDSAWRSFNYS